MAVTMAKDFKKALDDLKTGDRKVFLKASALVLALIQGEDPLQAPRPESRLKEALKWDLGDGYRCLGVRASGDVLLLHVGKHDDVERFIARHRGFYAPKEGSQITQLKKPEISEYTLDACAESSLAKIDAKFFTYFGITDEKAKEHAATVSSLDSVDSPEFLELLSQLPGPVADSLLEYALDPAKQQAIEGLVAGTYEPVEGEKLISLAKRAENSEEFVTFDDPEGLEEALKESMEDWMLYLHPIQRRWAYSTLSGPARLRGISGSGKTSVAIHRASHLARSMCGERDFVLFTTFSPGLCDVVRGALERLCGLELNRIITKTIGQWCSGFLRQHVGTFRALGSRDAFSKAFIPAYQQVRREAPDEQLWGKATPEYLYDEIRYIKGKFIEEAIPRYLSLQRHGRSMALSEPERRLVIKIHDRYQLNLGDTYDFEDLPRESLRRIMEIKPGDRPFFRAVIIDEVQDFSQIELRLLFEMSGRGENQFFMVGDGAQKIYRAKAYSLSSIGIDISGRATVLKKNYRNTKQIMRAAYELVRTEEFEDIGEDSQLLAVSPDYSVRNGPRPIIAKFSSFEEECSWVTDRIKDMVSSSVRPEGIAILSSGTASYRKAMLEQLLAAGVPAVLYSDSQAFTEPKIKISTFESAKGLEFATVFIMGATSQHIPSQPRENVSKFYVALTRARDQLFITYCLRARDRVLTPSPMLNRIESFCSFEDLSSVPK